jgi:hypothetical protein
MPKGVYNRLGHPVPPPPQPSQATWAVCWVHNPYMVTGQHQASALLNLGWEPFAMDQGTLWLRRAL